ncbi:MAG TPA: FtsX-like permease family protein [Gaiellaceae bacterium]|nr:FtsX-like permease family protein [Gaiellaceae bacterium]
MTKLFGIPVGALAAAMAVLLALAVVAIAVLAARNRIFFRLGVRNVGRRRGRAALIVAGLMLATVLITASFATGDTMSQSIRASALAALGRADEVVGAKGIVSELAAGSPATGIRWLPQADANRIRVAGRRSGLVAGVAPLIVQSVAIQDVSSRGYEPQVILFASDPASLTAFGPMRASGKTVSLAQLAPNEIYLNTKGADALNARAGDSVRILTGTAVRKARVRAVVDYSGAATSNYAVLMPLPRAQALLGKPGQIDGIYVANRGGVGATDEVVKALKPTVGALGLEADKTRQNALNAADSVGAAFITFFTTFGSFSIAAGILLIFLIFVMLAAERRSELGIARAVGTRRTHLVQMFLYEGAAYDLVAALCGAALGVGIAYLMVLGLGGVFSGVPGFHLAFGVKPASLAVAFAIGVLLTLGVLAFSASRVSRMNIVSAIRDLPDPPVKKHVGRRRVGSLVVIALGAVISYAGIGAKNGVTLGFGVMLVILGVAWLLALLGVNQRVVRTGCGLALVIWFVVPSISHHLFGPMNVNFGIFILGGLAIVIGATWTIMYNADLLLGVLGATLARVKAIAPVLRMAMAYPLRSLFRTGVTLAMFMLVTFTLVVGATTTGAFTSAFDNVRSFGGGFDVRATASPTAPVRDIQAAVRRSPVLRPLIAVAASKSTLPVEARQVGTSAKPETYLLGGLDHAFLATTSYGLDTWARGYDSPAAVWHALDSGTGLAVVDPTVVPRRANWGFGNGATKFRLHGFYVENKGWAPVRVSVRDPQTGRHTTLKVIGVLSDAASSGMAGIWTSQTTLTPVFGPRVLPTIYLFKLRAGVDPAETASKLQTVFMANGMKADSIKKLLSDAVSSSVIFDRLLEGFMGLGLIVGVAALGVITARAVVERRQQIGVLRAIGFQRWMVQASLLIESSFIALSAILVGAALGLVVAYNVIDSSGSLYADSGTTLSFSVPWLTLGVIFLVVYAIALATTLIPARHAARVYPAEALRYQ